MNLLKALVTSAIVASCSPAMAEMVCGERDNIVSQLESKYGERIQSRGLQGERGVVEVYANTETGSWTITVTDIRGVTCLMAAGVAFQIEEASEQKKPA